MTLKRSYPSGDVMKQLDHQRPKPQSGNGNTYRECEHVCVLNSIPSVLNYSGEIKKVRRSLRTEPWESPIFKGGEEKQDPKRQRYQGGHVRKPGESSAVEANGKRRKTM